MGRSKAQIEASKTLTQEFIERFTAGETVVIVGPDHWQREVAYQALEDVGWTVCRLLCPTTRSRPAYLLLG